MSLEESMLKLAASMDRYADTLDRISKSNPTQIAVATGGTAGETAEAPVADKKPGRGKAKAVEAAPEPEAAEEVDPFADEAAEEEAAPELTAEVIRALIMKVKEKNKDHAMAIIKKVGADTISKIDPKQYEKVVELAGKVGVSL